MNFGGIALNRKLVEDKSGGRLIKLLEFTDAFNRVTELEETLQAIGEAAHEFMNAQAISLMLLNSRKDALQHAYSTGPLKDQISYDRIPLDRGIVGWVAEHRLPVIANDIDEEDLNHQFMWRDDRKKFVPHNVICAPLLSQNNELMGVLEAFNRFDARGLNEDDLTSFQMLAKYAASTIERVQSQQTQDQDLKQKEMYLTEINHRVKNDLALISGIVEVESFEIEDERAKNVLNDVRSRIQSMATVYELLSQGGANTKARLDNYFTRLVQGVKKSFSDHSKTIDIEIEADPVILDPYNALSCGLILNELMLNSHKHAFKNRKEGLIQIKLTKIENKIIIDYKDDGPGLPTDFKFSEQDSIGFKMIQALVKQLEGHLEIGENGHAHFVICFRLPEEPIAKAPLNKA